jgi:hypothetical protein
MFCTNREYYLPVAISIGNIYLPILIFPDIEIKGTTIPPTTTTGLTASRTHLQQ